MFIELLTAFRPKPYLIAIIICPFVSLDISRMKETFYANVAGLTEVNNSMLCTSVA
jgi:hypothetical protein